MPFPSSNPIEAGWFSKGTPVDATGSCSVACPNCGLSEGEGFVAIVGRHGGLGAPYFIKPFLKRASTRGKVGERSSWSQCTKCNALMAQDSEAHKALRGMGLSGGFGV